MHNHSSKQTAISPATVLIVDNETLSTLDSLRHPHYKVIASSSGEPAVQINMGHPTPDLILLDAMMPEMDDYKLVSSLRNKAATREIPVIFVWGLGSCEEDISLIREVTIKALAESAETRYPEAGYHIRRTRETVGLLVERLLSRPHYSDPLSLKVADAFAASFADVVTVARAYQNRVPSMDMQNATEQ